MWSEKDFYNDLWHDMVGIPFREPGDVPRNLVEDLEVLNWDPSFIKTMRDRMIQGYFRYGDLECERNLKRDPGIMIRHLIRRAELFMKTKDRALLADLANLSMIAFRNSRDRSEYNIRNVETEKVRC